jgi:DNA invertase Pin-like site-specific DNA recombinase
MGEPVWKAGAGTSETGRAIGEGRQKKRGCQAQVIETRVAHGQTRAQLRRALDQLDKGDVLMVTRLDRLARSTRDLLNTVAAFAGRGAGFRSLGDTWADSTTRTDA